uniref:Ig-like domain-containing protein n=1 Tax=Lates calcarifer TaxID=8187 RepID=A0A4W6CHE6_LATCA
MKGFILELKSCCVLSILHSGQIHSLNISLFFSGSSEDLVKPSKDVMMALEGDTVTLSCSYSQSVQNLYWYQQKSSSSPQLLMMEHSKAEGLSFNHDKKTKEFHLQISSAAVTDSAVYYCAVRPTVTGNTTTLYKNLWSKDNTILHNIH